MSRVVVPATFLAIVLAILFWAFGIIPAALLWRIEVGLVAALLLTAIMASWRAILHKKQTKRDAEITNAVYRYVAVIASEDIHKGDICVIENGKARRAASKESIQ